MTDAPGGDLGRATLMFGRGSDLSVSSGVADAGTALLLRSTNLFGGSVFGTSDIIIGVQDEAEFAIPEALLNDDGEMLLSDGGEILLAG